MLPYNSVIKILLFLNCFLTIILTFFLFKSLNKSLAAFEWPNPPVVAICQKSLFTEDIVQSSLDFWKYRDNTTYQIVDNFNCPENEFIPGFILIGPPEDLKEHTLGLTSLKKRGLKIVSVKIQIRYYSHSEHRFLLLTHELGHAFGYKHSEEIGHIMFPNLNQAGWKDWGLFRTK